MTTLTYASNTIMAYVGADSGVKGVSGLTGMPVWSGAKVYFLQTSFIGPGLRQFDIDPDGNETLQVTQAALGVSQISATNGGAACVLPDGSYLHFISNFGNSVQLAKVRASDLTLTATFGTANGSTGPSTSSNIIAMHALNSTGTHLVAATEYTTQEVDTVLETFGANDNTNNGNLDTAGAGRTFGILLGPGNGTTIDAYMLGLPFANGSGTTTSSLSFYKLTSGGTLTKLGSITPANIDGTWTHFSYVAGCAWDASDGHVIFGAQTTDSVANKQYIVKINSSSGAVIWTRAINVLTPYAWSFTFSRINGKYHYLDGSSLARHITTSDGSQTTETVTGLTVSGPQFSDDTTNSIILYGTFTAGGSPPNYVGSVMGTGGNHNVTSWLRFWFATAGGGGGGNGGNRGGLTLSRKRAWTYTQDGHTFYVLDLSTEGTWVYDATTKQWAQFQTQGSGQWDFQAGLQWNTTRIVGGDLATTDMWELGPSLTQDHDGALDIAHIVTGGLQTRSRTFHSVDAVRLTGSPSTIGNPVSSVMKLRFSDDQGKTWSQYFNITVTAGVESEVEWRSLGAFDAPGRIFEISDTGGMVRIDGCDVFVEDFDDDSPSPQT